MKNSTEVVIIGGGIVGLCLAHQLIKRNISKNIIILEKEKSIGCHSSGRNSGVIHAGLYYKPNSLKADVCVSGGKRLKSWIKDNNLSINKCGKIIIPTKRELDNQLDLLLKRGIANGAKVELINDVQLKNMIPEAKCTTNRALWSPETAVIKPLEIMHSLENNLLDSGVQILKDTKNWELETELSQIRLKSNKIIKYSHLINCAGVQAEEIAKKFNIGSDYILIPFKGHYWRLKKECKIKISTNLYPVPDLNVPFLGVHFTPTADNIPIVNIGPTASFCLGRENYFNYKGIEPIRSSTNLRILIDQYLQNKDNFRGYVHKQAFLASPRLFLKAAQDLIPCIKMKDIERSQKVGIRSQLYNKKANSLEDDFLCLEGKNSTHLLNAISPAFTSSFSLADLIIDRSNFF